MTTEAPGKVDARHLARTAFLYVRQSTLHQVSENTESTRRQYALSERAVALGWPRERIEVIDCDLGQSGASAAERHGFQRLVSEVSLGHAGIVLGLEVSRLARNCSDWHRLLELCSLSDTLILDEDGLYDPAHFNDRLLLGIKGTMSEAELHLLRARLRGGLLAKARRGELRIGLPVGFVHDEQGRVRLHPDAQVRQSIRALFDTFRRTGSACATVKYFREHALLFPRPAERGARTAEILWRPLTLSGVVRVLHNPRYAGAFAFGRRRSRKHPEGGCRITSMPREQWHALVRDAHEGYIAWEEYERVQQRLRSSALAYGLEDRRAPPREGPALLQGMVLCGVCGSRMTVRYHERSGVLVPDYLCHAGTLQHRQPPCQIIPGATIDAAMGELLVQALTPHAIELTLSVQAELQTRLEQADRLRHQQVERAEHEAALARRRYLQVDPDNRLVASTLEADWNERLRALQQAREQSECQRAADRAALGQASEARIRALVQDFPAVFRADTTTQRDRKRITALLLEDVTLLKSDQVYVHVRFRGGATETLTLPLPKNAWQKRCTPPQVVARVAQLLPDHEEGQIAERLNAEGFRSGAGAAFDTNAVRWVRYSYGLETHEVHLRRAGKLTVAEMALRLGQREGTVRDWACQGKLRGTRGGAKPTWRLDPVEDQPEPIRQLAARNGKSSSAPPEPPPTADAPEAVGGTLTSVDMAVRLGIGLSTLHVWARKGRLLGRRCDEGPRSQWRFAPIEAQPDAVRQRAADRATLRTTIATTGAPGAAAGRGAV